MKTLKEIVAEMRNITKPGETMKHTYELLHNFAHDIEASAKALEADRDNWRRQALAEDARVNEAQSVTDCNQHGNSAKVRHALVIMYDWILKAGYVYGYPDTKHKRRQLFDMMTKALSAPARNCELYKSESEAYQAYLTAMKNETAKTYVYFETWLFAEAKGETK